jgi:hypothetical protein
MNQPAPFLPRALAAKPTTTERPIQNTVISILSTLKTRRKHPVEIGLRAPISRRSGF